MPIDFDALVLGQCMATFALPVIVDPSASIPMALPYPAQGVFTSRPHDVMLIDGTIVSDMETTLGIRLSDFVADPIEGDRITVNGVVYWVAKFNPDGQGGGTLILRHYNPAPVIA